MLQILIFYYVRYKYKMFIMRALPAVKGRTGPLLSGADRTVLLAAPSIVCGRLRIENFCYACSAYICSIYVLNRCVAGSTPGHPFLEVSFCQQDLHIYVYACVRMQTYVCMICVCEYMRLAVHSERCVYV